MVLCIAGKLAGAIFLLIVYGIDWVKKEVFFEREACKEYNDNIHASFAE